MSKNTLLSELINYISANSSGNVVIAAPSSGYALDVTGTGRFTSTLTANAFTTPSTGAAGSTTWSFYHDQYAAGDFGLWAGSTNRLLINAAGNVGIGTSSPTKPLYISSTVSDKVYLTGGTTQNGILLDSVGTSHQYYYGAGNNLLVGGDQGNLMAYDVTTGRAAVFFDTSNNIRFGTTASSEWMRITSGGQLQIKQAGNTFNDGLRLVNTSANNWGLVMGGDNNLYFGYNTTALVNINSSTGTYTALSDKNKKKDFELSTIGLNEVMQLKPTLYRMKSDDNEGMKELGFIAQEVKDFIPNAYVENEDFIGLNYNPIVAALTKAIQELKVELDLLKQQ